MDYASADLLAAVERETCQNAFTLAEVEQLALHFLRWLYPLAPEGALTEVLHLLPHLNNTNPIGSDGVGLVVAEQWDTGEPGILKITTVFQYQSYDASGDFYKASQVDYDRLERVIGSYPVDTRIYSKGCCLWALTHKSVKLFAGTPGWYVVPEFIPVAALVASNFEIPSGWESFLIHYCLWQFYLKDEEPEMAGGYFQVLQAEMQKLGVHFDLPKSFAGAGDA